LVPPNSSVILTAEFTAASDPIENDDSPVFAGADSGEGSIFIFFFKNGEILRGSTIEGNRSATIQTPGGEEERIPIDNEVNPPGSGSKKKSVKVSKNEMCVGGNLNFCLHVSCSDSFPGGYGKKGGPPSPPEGNPDYQIVSYFIVKKKGGKSAQSSKSEKPDETCGALLGDVEVLNTARAAYLEPDAKIPKIDEDDDTVTITGPVCPPGGSKSGSKDGSKSSDGSGSKSGSFDECEDESDKKKKMEDDGDDGDKKKKMEDDGDDGENEKKKKNKRQLEWTGGWW